MVLDHEENEHLVEQQPTVAQDDEDDTNGALNSSENGGVSRDEL